MRNIQEFNIGDKVRVKLDDKESYLPIYQDLDGKYAIITGVLLDSLNNYQYYIDLSTIEGKVTWSSHELFAIEDKKVLKIKASKSGNNTEISAYIDDEEVREMISATIKVKFNNGEARDVNIKHIDFEGLLGIYKEDYNG